MSLVTNPILPGFNPDPSIVRVKDDYYIATSTFEWYPGVQIHHSRELANWELICRPLNRASLLDIRGASDGRGVWGPCLSHVGSKVWHRILQPMHLLLSHRHSSLGWEERAVDNEGVRG